ncbi:MAG TPA: hypothetical protein VL003_10325 [Pusillimonas sp.]|uniref:hypothetical protein n=1 Tax=Pusillimonas sp. TaxID=3040095 RepID=UPI002B7A6D9B|nr:hypothetical protein [Pusillimonas sp.]HUH88428.1 hypothetical protein [Pusillimonas sp.]
MNRQGNKSSDKGWARVAAVSLLACGVGPVIAMAAEFRDLAPVRLFSVETETVGPPKVLPPLPPAPEQGLVAGEGFRESLFSPSPDQFRPGDTDWSYRSRLKPYATYGMAGTQFGGAPLTVSTLTSSDTWELGAENWRYVGGDGTDLTLGSYSPRTPLWGGGARLGGIAISRSLTDAAVPEDQWEYGVAFGALNYTDAAASSGELAYGAGASDAVLRYGISPHVTLETQVQWAPDMVTAGLGGLYSTPWGAWRVGVAKATRNLHDGWRYRVGYDVSLLEDIRLSWLTEQRSGGFSDLGTYAGFSTDAGRTRNRVSTSVGLGRWGTVRGSYEQVTSPIKPLKQQFRVSQQFWFSPNLRVSLSAQRERVSGDYGLGLELSLPIR